jgi:hypothetical protein
MNSGTGKLLAGCLEKYSEPRHGRLSLCKGEGEGEGFSRAIGERDPTPHAGPLPFCEGRGGFLLR